MPSNERKVAIERSPIIHLPGVDLEVLFREVGDDNSPICKLPSSQIFERVAGRGCIVESDKDLADAGGLAAAA